MLSKPFAGGLSPPDDSFVHAGHEGRQTCCAAFLTLASPTRQSECLDRAVVKVREMRAKIRKQHRAAIPGAGITIGGSPDTAAPRRRHR